VKSHVPSSRRSPLFYDILAYFADHPEAKDTVEGIVTWWLLEQRIKQTKAQAKSALTQLVAAGLLIAREGTTGRVYYRVNRQKMRKVHKLLREKQDGND